MRIRILLLLLAGVQLVSAQENSRPWMPLESRIGLAIGLGKITYLDKNTSPLIYQAQPRNVKLFYNLESNKMLFAVDLDVKIGGTKAKYHQNRELFFHEEDYKGKSEDKKFPVGGSFLAGRISVGGYYKIPSTQESTFKVAAGLRISNEMFYPDGWTSGGMFNALSFAPEGLVMHRVDKHHSFVGNIRIPLVAAVSRLPYHNTVSAPGSGLAEGFFKNTKWTGVEKFLAPSFGVGYQYQFNNKWGASLNYDFSWYNIRTPQQMKAVSQSLLANFYHNF